jgi:RNAse (barnase) inhibitor barstar
MASLKSTHTLENGRNVFLLDAQDFSSIQELYTYIQRYTHTRPTNLDAFRDVLNGFGELPPPYIFIWKHSQKSRTELKEWDTLMEMLRE